MTGDISLATKRELRRHRRRFDLTEAQLLERYKNAENIIKYEILPLIERAEILHHSKMSQILEVMKKWSQD